MEGREVNSNVPKLYLIFIYMNAQAWDRLPQTNWNAWDQGGLHETKLKKDGGGGVTLRVYGFLRVYKEGRIHWYVLKVINHYGILIFSPPAYTHPHIKCLLIPADVTSLLGDFADGELWGFQTGPLLLVSTHKRSFFSFRLSLNMP